MNKLVERMRTQATAISRCFHRLVRFPDYLWNVKKMRSWNREMRMEWAEDHTHLEELCKKAGCTDYEVYGDSYGVPTIQDLADLLYSKIKSNGECRHDD
ncbi:MAG: hypothetical protein AAF571_03455 [Verrucomicrobiota bacterium]